MSARFDHLDASREQAEVAASAADGRATELAALTAAANALVDIAGTLRRMATPAPAHIVESATLRAAADRLTELLRERTDGTIQLAGELQRAADRVEAWELAQ